MNDLQPHTTIVESLAVFPAFDDPTVLCHLKAELPAYVAAVKDVSPDVNILEWWNRHEHTLPKLVKQLFLCSQVQLLLSEYFQYISICTC